MKPTTGDFLYYCSTPRNLNLVPGTTMSQRSQILVPPTVPGTNLHWLAEEDLGSGNYINKILHFVAKRKTL